MTVFGVLVQVSFEVVPDVEPLAYLLYVPPAHEHAFHAVTDEQPDGAAPSFWVQPRATVI